MYIIRPRYVAIRVKVVVEVHQIATVARIVVSGEKTVDGGTVSRANDEVVLGAPDCGSGRRAGRITAIAEGVDQIAKKAEPDHDLVVLGAVAGGAGEGVVDDVGAEGIAAVAVMACQSLGQSSRRRGDLPPRPAGGNGADGTDLLAVCG